MFRYLMRALFTITLASIGTACLGGTPTDWRGSIYPSEYGAGFRFGAQPGWEDGYDGQTPFDVDSFAGIVMVYYRSGGGWPTGFYTKDYESPIPAGGSKTWWGIRLWSHNYTPQMGDRAGTVFTRDTTSPVGWWGKLVLDYSPAYLNWTGATEWWFRLYGGAGGYGVPALPCPITDDPFNPDNVTRLHLEVYTTPEPSSLAALGLALGGLAGVLRRRRR